MRRYGSFAYGTSQYGLGWRAIYARNQILFNDFIDPVHVKRINYRSNIQFSDFIDPEVLVTLYYADGFEFISDIRLKYVRLNYASEFTFEDDARPKIVVVLRYADEIVFEDQLIGFNLVKIAHQSNDIVFGNDIFMRFNWAPVPDDPDNPWVPRPHDGDLWVPRVSPSDQWTPREQNNG